MRNRPIYITLVIFLLSISIGACTNDSSGGSTGNEDIGPDSPLVVVPPEVLSADPAGDCPGSYASTAPGAGQNGEFRSADQARDFWLILPDKQFEGPRPLFVAFNGTNENGNIFSSRAQLTDFSDRGFIVAAPSSNANGTVWPVWDGMRQDSELSLPNADLTYFDELVQCLAGHYEIDKNRIYVGGHSAGGIFTNHVLQRRSEMIAGAIAASGVFSLTSPAEPKPLSPTFALVTWGGPDDTWGGTAAGTTVPEINFVEQASLTSQFYQEEANVGQAHCSADVGHAWLSPINDWMINVLLDHPKGLPGADSLELPEVPAASGVTCSADTFLYEGGTQVTCPQSTTDGCREVCQMSADCGVENSTVSSVLGPQLKTLGFSGDDNTDCSGCVTTCETKATDAGDEAVLACFKNAQAEADCGPGIDGAQPLPDAVNTCCDGRTDSAYCVFICETILTNTTAALFFQNCNSLF